MSYKIVSDSGAKKKHDKKTRDPQESTDCRSSKVGTTNVSKGSNVTTDSSTKVSEKALKQETSGKQNVVESQKSHRNLPSSTLDTFQEAREELIAEIQSKKRRNSDPLLNSLEMIKFNIFSSAASKMRVTPFVKHDQVTESNIATGLNESPPIKTKHSSRKQRATLADSPRHKGYFTSTPKKVYRSGTSPDERKYLPSDDEVFGSSPDTLSSLQQLSDEISKEEFSWGSSLSTEESSLLSSIDQKDDNESESEVDPTEMDSMGLFRIDNPEFHNDPLAENAIIWKERHGVKFIKAATPAALIHMLADASVYSDKDFIDTFLLTYEYWTDAVTVLKLLYNQYVAPKIRTKDGNVDNEENLRLWIQLRVINVIKKWIELKYYELRKQKAWQNTLNRFLRYLANRSDKERSWAAHLKKLMKQHSEVLKLKVKGGNQGSNSSLRTTTTNETASNLSSTRSSSSSLSTTTTTTTTAFNSGGNSYPTDSSTATSTNVMGSSPTKSSTQQTSLSQKILNEYSVKDIARQMCIMDYNLFKAIKLSEYYRKQFEKDALKKEQQASNNKASKQKETSNSKREDKNQTQQIISSNVLKATERFNQVTYWVATEIVLAPSITQRVKYLTKFIHIMEELRQEKDFNGLMQIYSALHFSYVTRLKKSWRELDIRTQNIFKTIQQLMSTAHHYKTYRETLDSLQPPGVPVQGLILSDLVYIEELPDREGENNEYVNWEKMSMLAKVFSLVLKFQKLPYTFDEIPQLSSFFSDLPNQARILSETELQERSATAEKDEELVNIKKLETKTKTKTNTKALFKTPAKEKTKTRLKGGQPLQLKDIWEDKTLYEKFRHYLTSTHNIENLLFYEEVEDFKQTPTLEKARQIMNTYLHEDSEHYVSSVDLDTGARIRSAIKEGNIGAELFDDAQKEVEMQVLNISFTNFLQEKAIKS